MYNINQINFYNVFYDAIGDRVKNFSLIDQKMMTIASASLLFASVSCFMYSYLKPLVKKFSGPTVAEKLEMLESGRISLPLLKELGDRVKKMTLDDATSKELVHILSACPNIQILELENCLITNEVISVLSNTVEMCVFKNCDVQDQIENDKFPPCLSNLMFINCNNLTHYAFPPTLSGIQFIKSEISEELLKNLPRHLRHLNMSFCDLTKLTAEKLPDQLKYLRICGCTNLHSSLEELLLENRLDFEITESDVENFSLNQFPSDVRHRLKLKNSHNIFKENELIPFINSYKSILESSVAILSRVSGINIDGYAIPVNFFAQCYANALKKGWKVPAFNTFENQKIALKKIRSRTQDPVAKLQRILLKKLRLDGKLHQLRIEAFEEVGNPKRKASDVCKKIKGGELVIMASGAADHSIDLVFYASFMVICNRGLGSDYSGTTMQVTPINPEKLTEDLCDKILNFDSSIDWQTAIQSKFFYKDLPNILRSKKIHAKRKKQALQLQSAYESNQSQRVGNCIAASLKLANRACLGLLYYKNNPLLNKKIVSQVKQLSKCESYLIRRYAEELCLLTSRSPKFTDETRNDIDRVIEASAEKRARMSQQYDLESSK